MDDYYSVSGASTSEQSGLPGTAAFFKSMPNSFANSTDTANRLQKEHDQQRQRTQFLFHQQQRRLQQPIEPGGADTSHFVSLPALNSAPEATPLAVERHSSTSTQSSSGWADSPASNAADSLSSPTSSVISPPAQPIDPLLLGSSRGAKGPQKEDGSEISKRRRGRPRLSDAGLKTVSAAAQTQAQAPAPAPAKIQKKKSASRRTSTASASGVDERADERGGGAVDDKKNRIRARNREAAYKCRQKKQKGIEELQTQEAMMESVNKSLNNEAAQLRGEILMLKNMVLQHGSCGCPYIEEYISGAAQSLVQSSMAASASAPASVPGRGMQMHSQDCVNGTGGDGYIDWNMFDMDAKAGVPSLESESVFSGYDDAGSHSARAHSQAASMD
ncbi:bZIP transcription factor [Colletotrichum falcatum]|nr:bZIP transcription factor [Colletotrichum falcatum]